MQTAIYDARYSDTPFAELPDPLFEGRLPSPPRVGDTLDFPSLRKRAIVRSVVWSLVSEMPAHIFVFCDPL